jgi:hypothetical protein
MNPLRHNVKQPQGGQTDHLAPFSQDIAPNPVRSAIDCLFPWSSAANLRGRSRYPGIYAGTVTLLGGKAKPDTLKDWCSGRRNAPNWFVAVLRDRLLQQRQEIDAALEALEKLPERRGHGAGLRDWWRDKRY